MNYNKCFLYIDVDAFFASVEQLDHPEWKRKPVIVGGLPEDRRSVVSTASYEARKFGVHSAMPTFQAVKLCPDGIFTRGRYERYSELSNIIMEHLKNYSPELNQISIDEACLDISGTQKLFGEPDKLALRIQKEIFSLTGLTISVGLACNKYLAKLSSEVNKPNGFFMIPSGKEEEFMLSLPLKKVWGIGQKTLENLNKKGFYTTKDIHSKPIELLKSLFGNSTGEFLYNSVRGIETLQKTEKSHSISNEETFSFDITDRYTAETKLLELAHSVMFRMKKAKLFSKTVMLKIRYEDFTTTTVQFTSEDYITSVDDLYQKACSLFEKKYIDNLGIRLLGLGLENLQDNNTPKQELLFDFGSKKKQAVEDAILKLSEKHPEIKIQKARLLKTTKSLLFALCSLLLLKAQSILYAEEENIQEKTGAASINSPNAMLPLITDDSKTNLSSLFNYNIKDKEIEFLASGWWQGEFTGSIESTHDSETETSLKTPVFKQQVDMSLWFMLNKQFYFEADFADSFYKNTIALGFYGKESNPLKELRIANRSIKVLGAYTIDDFNRGIGGGDNQAPGIFAHFEDPVKNKWKSDFVLRYDMTEQKNATYYGKTKLSEKLIELSKYISGQFFVLPQKTNLINKISNIYIEDTNGSYKDDSGRKFKKIPEDEYILISSKNMIVISKDALSTSQKKLSIIVSFTSSFTEDTFGNYSDSQNGISSFLGEIQDYFSANIDLKNFAYDFFATIDGHEAILIQNSTGFSPFVIASYYDVGLVTSDEIIIGNATTKEKSDEYGVQITDELESFINSAFLNQRHSYAEVYKNENTFVSNEPISPEIRYPLAKTNPAFYLNYSDTSDLKLIVNSYTPVYEYDIGLDVSANSVRVYKNGIQDTGASYDKETGTVTLSSSVSELDKIYITWKEDSNSAQSGALATQASFEYSITKKIKTDISLASFWTLSPYVKYAEYEKPAEGYVTIESGFIYKTDNVELSNAFAGTLENKNITSKYRIWGMDNEENKTSYLSKNSMYILPSDFVPYINTDEAIILDEYKNKTVNTSESQGISDEKISGYKLPLEWSFLQENDWAAMNISLTSGSKLKNAKEFRFALKNENPNITDFDIYLQLGIKADAYEDDKNIEYAKTTPTWKITNTSDSKIINAFTSSKEGWQEVRVLISDTQRSFIGEYKDARLVVVAKSKSDGIISMGPYEIITEGIFTNAQESLNVTSEQKKDNSIPQNSTYNTDDNYIQNISWSPYSNIDNFEQSFINIAKYFEEVDIAEYNHLNFYYKIKTDETTFKISNLDNQILDNETFLTIILDRNASSITTEGKIAIKAKLYKEAVNILYQNSNDWATFAINIREKTIKINGLELPKESYSLEVHKNIIPSRFKISFSSLSLESTKLTKGLLSLDELRLEDNNPYFLLQDIAKVNLKKDGAILKTHNEKTIVEDAFFNSKSDGSLLLNTEYTEENTSWYSSDIDMGITVTNINMKSSVEFSSQEESIVASASQEVCSKKPFFDILSFNDKYIFNKIDSTLQKESLLQTDFTKLHIPLSFLIQNKSEQTSWLLTNNIKANSNLELKKDTFTLIFNINAGAKQKSNTTKDEDEELIDSNYFEGYTIATENSFSQGKSSAYSRTVTGSSSVNIKLPVIYLSPFFSIASEEKYSNSSYVKYTNKTDLKTALPFKIQGQNISLNYERKKDDTTLTSQGGNYKEDFDEMFCNIYDSKYFFNSILFYELFSSDTKDDLLEYAKENQNVQTQNYSSIYELNWKRDIFSDIRDLFIPSNFLGSLERTITAASDTSDIYNIKLSLLNTPFNLFGSQSTLKLFNWYKTDEHAFSFASTISIPKEDPDDTLYTISTYLQSSFYIKDSDTLKTGIEYTINTDSSWKTEGTIIYRRKTSYSPVKSLINSFTKHKYSEQIKLTRTNSIDATLNYSHNKLSQKYETTHKIETQILKYLSLYFSTTGSAYYTSKEVLILNLSETIGAKITF